MGETIHGDTQFLGWGNEESAFNDQEKSRAAHIEGGIYGPALEDGLRPHGYTLRHFPPVLRAFHSRRLDSHTIRRPRPYFTVIAPGRPGDQVEQWDEIKLAVMEALIDLGGTTTRQHAVGCDHRPGYDRQRPELFAEVLRATKKTLDPVGMLNPGGVGLKPDQADEKNSG